MNFNKFLQNPILRNLIPLLALLLIIAGLFEFHQLIKPSVLQNQLPKDEKLKTAVLNNLTGIPAYTLVKKDGSYVMTDTTTDGINIQEKGAPASAQGSGVAKQNFEIDFPQDYSKPMDVKLDAQRDIQITDNSKQSASSKLLTDDSSSTLIPSNPFSFQEKVPARADEVNLPHPSPLLEGEGDILQPSYLEYQSGNKEIFYAYQKDQGTGEKQLKDWIIYQSGNGNENESYTFQNAKLKQNSNGDIEVYYFGQQDVQNQQVEKTVDPSLMERAQKTLQKELGEDILNGNQTPDLTIPKPYYLDKDGNRTELDWNLDQDKNTISFTIKTDTNKYPLAFDPTLQFTAPGQSSSGSVINGETGSCFSVSMAAGDFNADGKTDLAVGAYQYSSNRGRVYIFYGGSLASSILASSANVVITGESNSFFGSSLAAGDFNADGKTDLAVGADLYSSNTGRAYIFYGGSLASSIAASSANVIITGESGSCFGYSMAAGDFNADGKTDLVVGAYIGGSSNQGRAYIFYGSSSLPATIAALSANVIITGQNSSDYFGYSMAAGDFNGDGKMDLAVGANYGGPSAQGRAYIFYGSSLSSTIAAENANVIITGENNFDQFGKSMAAGDFNADGKTDLAVGAYGYNVNQGRAYIFYGSSSLPSTIAAENANVIITGENSSDRFGYSMISGDFNGDGKTDLAVGAYGYSSNTGRAYIFYGSSSLSSTISASSADVIITGEMTSNYFSLSMAAGDFNGDGKTDLAVGSLGYSSNTGRAYIFYSQNGVMNTNFSVTGEATNNYFGTSMIAGDFNGDGKTDLAVGAIFGGSSHTGRAYIFYGGSLPSTIAASSANVIITGENNGDQFGYSMAAGDFNGDGKTDLAVGADFYSTYTGRAYIFYGSSSLPATIAASSANVIITGETGGIFGYSMTAGDFNNDGKMDLAVGATYAGPHNQGRAYIFYGSSSLPSTIAATSANVIIDGENIGGNNLFGFSMAAGDFNGDGKMDLAVGAYCYLSQTGRAYIFYGSSSLSSSISASNANVIITGENTSDAFGYSMAAGDFNADGKTDLAVGADFYSTGIGRAYIFYGSSSLPSTIDATSANVIITGEHASSEFGSSMTTGDFNGDGRTDLAIGANYGGPSSQGRAYIFYSSSLTTPTSLNLLASSANVIITGENNSDQFGFSMAAGDFNGDGKIDLAVGADNYNSNQGRVYIYNGAGSNYSWTLQPQKSTRTSPISGEELKIDGQASSQFGYSMVAGDFNGDGRMDLAVGADAYNSNQGRVYIFYNDGLLSINAATADVVITGEATGNDFGYSMAAGDFNADGKTDLAVGATGYNSSQGRVYIFYGGSLSSSILASSANVVITGENTSDSFGNSMAAGDFNGDGKTDLAIGADVYPSFGFNGRVYIFYGGSLSSTIPASNANVIITDQNTEQFGWSMTAGDFNADGKTDLAVGAIAYTHNNGRAYIFYGSGSLASMNASSANVIITGENTSSFFGYSMTAGDFNGDGKTDLAVGANQYSTQTGRAYIFYGSGSLSATIAASNANVIITGETTNNYFGQSMAAGDFNSDGKTDLVVGAYHYSSNAGRAYIFYGSGSLSATIAASSANVIITGEAGSVFGSSMTAGDFNADGKTDLAVGATGYSSNAGRVYVYTFNDTAAVGTSSSNLGYSMAAGDFNGDGKMDLAVGAYGYNSNQGRAYIFYGGGSSVPTDTITANVVITGENAGNAFGASMAAGDFNGDGKTDLAVGAYGVSSSNGRAYIFYGSSSLSSAISASNANSIFNGENSGDYFSSSMAAGDFNGDGKTDLAVGSYYVGVGYQGKSYVFYGSSSLPATISASSANVIITGDSNSGFGISMAAGDFNGDGKADLSIGAYRNSSAIGCAYIFYGGSMAATIAASSANVIITGESAGYFFGASLAAGDFNGDGKTDLAVGAYGYPSGNNQGRAYIFYGSGSLSSSISASNANVIITGENTGDYFSSSMTAGDFNGDGKTDLAVGAYGVSSSAGRAYIFYGSSSLSSAISASNANSIFNGENSGDYFSSSMTAGDFNADGKTDIAIGAYGYNSNAGKFYIYISETQNVTQTQSAQMRGTMKFRGNAVLK